MSELRAAFRRAQDGDQSAQVFMTKIALEGDADAEALLYEEVRKAQVNTNFTFAEAFRRVTDAHPKLHLCYLNSN